MKKIICNIPTATSPINGLEFEEMEGGGLISKEAHPDDVTERFGRIPGYTLIDEAGNEGAGTGEGTPTIGNTPAAASKSKTKTKPAA